MTIEGGIMSEQITIQEFQLDLEQLHRRAAALTQELGNANYALREKRRELAEVNAAIEARVHDRTRDLAKANEQLRESDWLRSIFGGID
jgi:nitrate/nitrite-specific signal transduction histidine kinase